MLPTSRDDSPIGFNARAFASDGEVDEANLFFPDDTARVLDEVALEKQEGSKELADALEALLAPITQANDEGDAVAAEQDVEPEEVDVLQALLEESLGPVRAAREVKAAREKLARGGLTKAERLDTEQRIREWEAKVEWRAIANCALFTQQICQCGTQTTVFSGLLERQVHRTKAATQRWIAVTTSKLDLENEVAVQDHSVGVCASCASPKGFNLSKAYRIHGEQGV